MFYRSIPVCVVLPYTNTYGYAQIHQRQQIQVSLLASEKQLKCDRQGTGVAFNLFMLCSWDQTISNSRFNYTEWWFQQINSCTDVMQMFRFSMSCRRKHLETCYMASKLQHLLQCVCNSLSWIYSSAPWISSQSLCHLFCDETISVAFVTPRTDAVCRYLTASTTICASQNTVLTIATVL